MQRMKGKIGDDHRFVRFMGTTVKTSARWRIADAREFLESVATESGAQSRLNDIIDSVVRDQVSASELVELVRSASWEVPPGEVLEEAPAEVQEELKKLMVRFLGEPYVVEDDLDVGYNGHKGKGYQVRVAETFRIDEDQEPLYLITFASDGKALSCS
jgi:regulator of protease activity HflC (stomatin/prohibitin superfamily)